MSILAYGLNYRTASLDLRERIAFPEEKLAHALKSVTKDISGVSEVAIVSTCNRTEFYCAADPNSAEEISRWLAETRLITLDELENASYRYWDKDAAQHIIRVASGLDSQMLGEPQIMGQVKSAYDIARSSGTIGPELNLLSRITLKTAKQIRSETGIGNNPISIAYAAVSMASKIFADLGTKKALLLGAGETIGLVADHLAAKNIGAMTIANRTLANAQVLATRYNADSIQLTDVAQTLHEFDIVIASTGSSLPVLGKGAVEAAIKKRKRRPMFMVDIAVPRDIEAEVAELPDAYLYTIDDLTEIVERNLAQRQVAASEAESIVAKGAKDFQREKRVQQDKDLLTSFRTQANEIRETEVARALRELAKDGDAEAAILRLSQNLTNKLIHPATAAMREASAENRRDLLGYLSTIYALPESNVSAETQPLSKPSDSQSTELED
ncbi:MAG: glutamyl-tRNA reductase [Pseudomonadales bacterium]|jgi:glutamyl-tRNA reductase|nr:glutamyl-tRNA reductase [Pseudomonadales bacterium]